MHFLMSLLLVVQLLSALAMIGLVLIQHGKGADMGASFGGGSSGSLFGATGSANFLSRTTAVLATVFFTSTLALAYVGNPGSGGGSADAPRSVLERVGPAASAAADAIPGAVPTQALPAAASTVPAAASAASR